MELLEARSLSCVRGTRLLFKDVNFQIRPGEIRQVRGANGAGKTSLLRILCGLSLPEHGEVLWNGKPIGQDRSDFHAQLAYIGHAPGLKLDLTARENLLFSLSLQAEKKHVDIDVALERAGLDASANLVCRHLSAGVDSQRGSEDQFKLIRKAAPVASGANESARTAIAPRA